MKDKKLILKFYSLLFIFNEIKKFLKKVIDKAYIEKFKLTHNILNNLIENSNKKFNL